MAEQRLFCICISVVKSYMKGLKKLHSLSQNPQSPFTKFDKSSPTSIKGYMLLERILDSKVPVISFILEQLITFSDTKLQKQLPFYYPIICDLSLSHSLPLRTILCSVLIRIGKLSIDPTQVQYPDMIYVSEQETEPKIFLSQTNTGKPEEDISQDHTAKDDYESIEMDSVEEE